MLVSAYSFHSLCLMAALALTIGLLLRLADRKLKLIYLIPSPLKGWENLCKHFVNKLNRKRRSANALKMRSWVLIFGFMALAFIIGTIISKLLHSLNNDYLDIILLGLLLFVAPSSRPVRADDEAAQIRYKIETNAIALLQRISAPILGWIALGWVGAFISLTLCFLAQHSALANSHFSKPIIRLSKLVFIPAGALSCLLLGLAALFTSKGRPLEALRGGMENLNAPHKAVVLTVAEAMGLSLAGPKSNYIGLTGREWLGKGTARLQESDLRRWRWLEFITYGLLIALLLGLSL